MIHMLCRFDLAPGVSFDTLTSAYAGFVADMQAAGLVLDSGPVGERVDDTPMDTDAATDQRYFVVMRFRDRAQMDRSYGDVATRRITPRALGDHTAFKSAIVNEVFTCWEDRG